MRHLTALLALTLALPCAAELPAEQTRAWLDHIVPMPQQIDLTAAHIVPRGSVRIIPADSDAGPAHSAAVELRRAVGESSRPAHATLRLLLGGARARDLRRLPSPEQAYRIESHASGREIRVIAPQPAGLYYGALTLAQLIDARSTDSDVTIPELTVIDWPDIGERGLWGSDSHLEIPWMARRKLNLVQQISWLHVTEDGRGEARLKDGREPMVTVGPDLAVHPVPAVLHLDQLGGKGLFEAYPRLRAQDGAENAICYSRPEFPPVLADWLVDLGSLPGVRTVEVWMAENLHGEGGCECPECSKEERSVLEARAIIAAWRLARERLPDLKLRVMTSEETAGSNDEVLAVLPPHVGINYYHSLFTYTAMRRLMIPALFAEAATDRWVGVVPSFVGAIRPLQPFTGPQFIHARMSEFASKGLSGVMGYATPRVRFARFNIEAAAEWSWNADGRSPRDFARSWAVRRRIPNPKVFADWTETLGPVAWDIYGSDWPAGMRRGQPGPVSELLLEGRLPPLGEIKWGVYPAPWGEITSPEELAAHVADAREALTLAQKIGDRRFVQETRVVQGYVESLAALHALRTLAPEGTLTPADRDEAAAQFRAYIAALQESAEALPRWERAVTGQPPEYTDDSVDLLGTLIDAMRETAARMDVPLQP